VPGRRGGRRAVLKRQPEKGKKRRLEKSFPDVLDAERGAYERDPMRVWVFANEIPDGTWGGAGRINTLADIAGFALGDPEQGRSYAEQRLAERRDAQLVS
jgi:hypothetical protein